MQSRLGSSRADAISTLMSMSKSVTRVGYVPAELQTTLNKGLQRPIYTSPPKFFSQRNPRLNQQAQRSPTHTIYQRPKRFLPDDPPHAVHVRNLANEIRTTSSPESYHRYPKQSFHTIQSASITYKIALSNHQTKPMNISQNIRNINELNDHKVGGFRPVAKSTAAALVNTKTSSPDPRKPEYQHKAAQDTFLTEPNIDNVNMDDVPDSLSPSPFVQQVLDDDALTDGAKYLYSKILTPERRRLDHYTHISHGYVGKEFIDITEKYSVGQKKFIVERYKDEYLNQLPSSQYIVQKSGISKSSSNRSSSLSQGINSHKKNSQSTYSQVSILAEQRKRDNKANLQAELNKLAWEDAFVRKIDLMNGAQLEEPVPSMKPQEKPVKQQNKYRKRCVPWPQLANMYTTNIIEKKRPQTAKSNSLNEVRELVVTAVPGQEREGRRPMSAIAPQSSSCSPSSSLDNVLSNRMKELIFSTKFMTNIAPSKAEIRDMCEFNRRTVQEEQAERHIALYNSHILDLFIRLGEQQASTFCEHYNKNRLMTRRLVLTQILYLCRQHMCMQYFKCISIVHNPFQSTQHFLECTNHCIVIRACLQALYRLRFFHLIIDQFLYYFPESFFDGIVKIPINQLGLSSKILCSYFTLKSKYNDTYEVNVLNKLMTSLSPDQNDLPASLDQKLTAEPETSVSTGLFPDHRHTIDLSLIEFSGATPEGEQKSSIANPRNHPEPINIDISEGKILPSALPTDTVLPSLSMDQQYLAPPSLEVAIAIVSALAESINIFTRQAERESLSDGPFLCGVIAFAGACNYDCQYEFISQVPLEDRKNRSSNLNISKVRARSCDNRREAPITRILDYLCVEILNALVHSYNNSSPDNLVYTTRSSKALSTASQLGIIIPLNKPQPSNTVAIDWSSLSLYDSFINTVTQFLISCSKDRFATEHNFLLEFNPHLSHRVFEAAAIALKNMPVHVAAQYFDRICLVAFCTITFIKGAIVSASTRKVISTIFQGVTLHNPYTIANGYYLLSTCINICLDMRIICKESQFSSKDNVKYLLYLFSELCLLSGIIVETHCLSLASGIGLGNLHMLFSNYPSDISGALPPFIFFFTGAEGSSHTDIVIDNEKTGIYLRYYVSSFIMRLGISYIRSANRLNMPISSILSTARVMRYLYNEYATYRDRYILIDEFCKIVCEGSKEHLSTKQ